MTWADLHPGESIEAAYRQGQAAMELNVLSVGEQPKLSLHTGVAAASLIRIAGRGAVTWRRVLVAATLLSIGVAVAQGLASGPRRSAAAPAFSAFQPSRTGEVEVSYSVEPSALVAHTVKPRQAVSEIEAISGSEQEGRASPQLAESAVPITVNGPEAVSRKAMEDEVSRLKKLVARLNKVDAQRPCRNPHSVLRDLTTAGPSTVVASSSYGAFVYAKCLAVRCVIQTVRQGARLRTFGLSKNQEWKGYEQLLAVELNLVRGMAQLTWCELALPAAGITPKKSSIEDDPDGLARPD